MRARARRRRRRRVSAERALQLFEEPLVGAVGRLVRVRVELLEQAPLLGVQVARQRRRSRARGGRRARSPGAPACRARAA